VNKPAVTMQGLANPKLGLNLLWGSNWGKKISLLVPSYGKKLEPSTPQFGVLYSWVCMSQIYLLFFGTNGATYGHKYWLPSVHQCTQFCCFVYQKGPSAIWDLCPTKASRPIEQVKNHGRACTLVLFLRTAELGFFSLFKK
jgi:hypothetical protein